MESAQLFLCKVLINVKKTPDYKHVGNIKWIKLTFYITANKSNQFKELTLRNFFIYCVYEQ